MNTQVSSWDLLVEDVDESCACNVAAAAEALATGAELILVLWDPHDIASQHQPKPPVAQLHGTGWQSQPTLARHADGMSPCGTDAHLVDGSHQLWILLIW